MKLSGKIGIPNIVIYAALYITIFGISISLLVAHKDPILQGQHGKPPGLCQGVS